jgi:hypothetical protein
MKRNIYFIGIFFLSWEILISLIQSLFQLQIGPGIFTLPSFIPWFVLLNLVSLVWIIILIKYYHHKKYRSAFALAIITTVAALYFYFTFMMMLTTGMKTGDYYKYSYFTYHGTGVLYSLSLIFSRAADRRWLRAAGFLGLITDLLLIILMIGLLNVQNVQLYAKIERSGVWISFAGPVLLFMYIMNFLRESEELKPTSIKRSNIKSTYLVFLGGFIALVITYILGIQLVKDQFHRESDRVENLAKPFKARIFVNGRGDTLRYRLLIHWW